MKKLIFSMRNIPGWVYTCILFGALYFSGLHTEAIGQVQRVLLASGFFRPDLPALSENEHHLSGQKPVSAISLPDDFLLQDLNGKTIKFSQFHNKVVFLNIWATWCPPCVAEMPGIQKLYDTVKSNKNFVFIMLSVDQAGSDKVKKFIAKKGYTFPVYLPASNLPDRFQTQSIPTTFILSKDGKIATSHSGMADYNTQKVISYLEELAR